MIKMSFTEKDAEKQTIDIIMNNSWNKIFKICKKLYRINYCLDNALIQEFQNYRIIRNLFVHGNGTVTQRFLSKFPKSNLNVGEIYVLNTEIISKYTNILFDIIPPFDEILLKKCPEIEFKKL